MWRGLFAIAVGIALVRAATFSGVIVEEHSGKPVRGARVQLRMSGAPRLTADMETGSDGTFQAAASMPDGEYEIMLSKDNFAAAEMRLRLPLTAPLALSLVRLASITGRVTDLQNRPMRGALLSVLEERDGQLRPTTTNTAQTDADGYYRLFHLPPGRYAVAISWATLNPASAASAYVYPNNRRAEIFALTGGEALRGIDFVQPVQSEFRVSGKLAGLEPAGRAGVTLTLREHPSMAASMQQTAFDGVFSFDGIAPGGYDLKAAGPATGYAGFGVALGPEPRFGRTALEAGGPPVEGITLPMEPGKTVKFTLRSNRGCPQAASIQLTPAENWGALLFQTLELDVKAEAVARNLAPGLYKVAPHKTAKCYWATQFFDARNTSEVQIELAPGGSIDGVLAAKQIPTATLVAMDAGETWMQFAPVGSGGTFRFSDLRPGRYRIRAGAATQEVQITSGTSTKVTVPLGVTP